MWPGLFTIMKSGLGLGRKRGESGVMPGRAHRGLMAPDTLAAVPESAEVSWDTGLCLDLVRTLLFRTASPQDLVSLMAVCGFDTTRDYVAIRARPLAGHGLA